MKHFYVNITLISIVLFTAISSFAKDDAFAIPAISGEITTTNVHKEETLMEIALREGYGFENIVNSNPQHDPWQPEIDSEIILPGKVITPRGAKPGIFINLAEMRLFNIIKTEQQYKTDIYPLGIGRSGRETPEGEYRVVVKKENPVWRVPKGLRAEDPTLPAIIPPGQDNPLGNFWLGLSAPGYGVHGTNRPYGVGRRISYGCLRMYPADIEKLYNQVASGTTVIIDYQPVKATSDGKSLFLEVHPDYLNRQNDQFQEALSTISKTGWPGDINYMQVMEVVTAAKGTPTIVGSILNQQ